MTDLELADQLVQDVKLSRSDLEPCALSWEATDKFIGGNQVRYHFSLKLKSKD